MSRAIRVHQIDQMLHNRGRVELQDFLDTLEVSLATFKRDLEFMRLQLNAPIIYDRDINAYRFEKSDSVGPKYELPGLWLNSSEAHALLTANALLEGIEPGLLGPHVQPLKSRLSALLATEGIDPESVSQRVRLIQNLKRSMPVKHFQQVARATLDQKRIKLRHLNRNSGEVSEREVSPQRLTYYRENWYLDAWCHVRNDIRSFAVDAVESVVVMATSAQPVNTKKLDATLSDGYGIFNGPTKKWAILEFTAHRAQWVSLLVWHAQQKVSWMPDGRYRVEIPYNDDRELINDILSHGADLLVVSPPELRQRIKETLLEAAGQYD